MVYSGQTASCKDQGIVVCCKLAPALLVLLAGAFFLLCFKA
jgi:hypothetical protein